MQKLVALLLIAVLAGSVTIPNVFSDNEKNTNDDNDTKTTMHFGFSNATSVSVTLPNGTKLTFGFSNGTNPGQQISAFIHQIRDAFKQQETLAKQTIKDCREKAKDASNPSDKKTVMDQCKAQLKQINQQFKGDHKLFQQDFKQFREMVIGNNQENHETPGKDNIKIHNTNHVVLPHGLEQKNSHDQNATQNTMPPNQHGMDEKQKRGKED